jgi:hypothetical protein
VRISDGKVGVGVNVGRESSGYTHGQGPSCSSSNNGVFYTPREGWSVETTNNDYSARNGVTISGSSDLAAERQRSLKMRRRPVRATTSSERHDPVLDCLSHTDTGRRRSLHGVRTRTRERPFSS